MFNVFVIIIVVIIICTTILTCCWYSGYFWQVDIRFLYGLL